MSTPVGTVLLPAALCALFPGAPRRLDVAAATVAGAIAELDARFPGMADRIRDSRPAIRRHLRIFVNGAPATLETQLAPGAELLVLTAVSGG